MIALCDNIYFQDCTTCGKCLLFKSTAMDEGYSFSLSTFTALDCIPCCFYQPGTIVLKV